MLEEAIKALVASMSDLAESNRELAAVYANARAVSTLEDFANNAMKEVANVTEEAVAKTEAVAKAALLNLDDIDPHTLFLLTVVHGEKPLTVADLEDIKANPPSKKLVDIATKIGKAFDGRQTKAKYFGHALVEFAMMFVNNLDALKTQKDFNEFWKQVEFSKPDERATLRPKAPLVKEAAAAAAIAAVDAAVASAEPDEMEFDDVPDFDMLRKQGAAMISDAAKGNRPGLVELLKKHKCITAENKISFGAAPDDELPVLVPAIKALIDDAAAAAAAAVSEAATDA